MEHREFFMKLKKILCLIFGHVDGFALLDDSYIPVIKCWRCGRIKKETFF